ncbi:DUF3919 family protein [Paenibacillus apiarius]|uniref:DUF3919 family protein n=1 Tax=Paenibacillus apiarius TaxID=46240 RepID=A0ABT4DLF6_9BACL|nr:DUF3919 family protein [Paenibacillus apiarius]MCY9513641.1 DUF3919 family protein [Paenibacillus apiarius]MCY9518192.1 DUF3919 family protein [Paenibacillus apiarius]MCY9551407.1 DUF3919 family protein [Paenibacillus apiarius]MCY9558561.1 DUF3919 family protein [Paenibacillus apiarius]MCY9684125.1 DUF3919 family protein [Paenibacillus apiarius]
MKKVTLAIFLCLVSLLLVFGIGRSLTERLYGKVIVIEDRNEVLKKVSDSLPVEVTIRHRQWGAIQVTDEVRLHSIISYTDLIKKENDPVMMKQESRSLFSGTIRYLNGAEQVFALGDTLSVDRFNYGSERVKPLLSAFRTHLVSLFYQADYFADFIENAQSVVAKSNGSATELHENEKGLLARKVRQSSEIRGASDIKRLLMLKRQPLGYITVYKNGKKTKNDRDSLVHLIVFGDSYIVQYMGDDNGNSIYMKGSLTELLQTKAKAESE